MLNSQSSLDRAFRALADPTRRAIVDRLSRSQASVSEIAKPLKMSLVAVVQHIQLLEECGVIRTQKSGRIRTCRIEPQALGMVERWLSERRAMWERHLDRLGAVLEEQRTAQISGKDES
jgi:DNA-binding transcriptional ArsR family regulator